MPSAFVDVWKLDFWYVGVYCYGHHSNLKGKLCISIKNTKKKKHLQTVMF